MPKAPSAEGVLVERLYSFEELQRSFGKYLGLDPDSDPPVEPEE